MSYEPEFQQALDEVTKALEQSTLYEKHPKYKKVLPVLSIPQKVNQFRVTWENDKGEQEVTVGYRVQYNNCIGPFKGGLRFHPTVNLSILKFLGFEQIFKNALTGTPIGGAKGGLCVNTKGRSENEIRRICNAFMRELYKVIGTEKESPAGDIGVSGVEVGYMHGEYRRLTDRYDSGLTGKGLDFGGSLIRPEATGYGVVYVTDAMIKHATNGRESFKGKRVAISGSGNVAQYAALKAIELGATVVSLSDSKGCVISEKGFSEEQIKNVIAGKAARKTLEFITSDFGFKYISGARPWTHCGPVDIVLPCATQNEVSGEEAEHLIKAGAKYVAEGSNMGSTPEAIAAFEKTRASSESPVWFCPPKLANMGGVMVSQFELAQNAQRISWTAEEVDSKLKSHMIAGLELSMKTAREYSKEGDKVKLPSLVVGANIAGFLKVANAMFDQGDVW
ncbi:probable NADP-specific glutamate dehydrogenase 1 [Saccharomycodes ludwigii]|uniref:Glutamate dehydrogenase n=1 Tax=Saccharomycodes ludwigii TaxID=36035 RepID=A0A376B523_9ASCO|nr:hypothetical protein SCDLUD_004960 [Saccharomycodes ludwigii]KAH3899514.1 hypothetical protein SCDLUD_004960 [Saccharomycodes ludwigii]SSD59230.1 probable NADP-specific glutamate dehydrogenase 1 [Saccharomycodes ludwigii]